MFSNIDDITITWEENGLETVKELDKVILTRGAWSTIIFKYQDWDRKNECYGPLKFSIRRYRKRDDVYRENNKFNISNIEQAKKVIGALQNWIDKEN